MSSVSAQSTTNGNTMPMTAVPGNLTKDKLNVILQRAKFLHTQGAQEDNNPEYAQIMQFLKNLQRQQKMQQQRQTMQPFNPMTPGMQPVLPGQSQPGNVSQPQPFVQTPPSASSAEPTTNPAGTFSSAVFTQQQLAILRYQIMAYKLISRNMPVPAHIQQAILSSGPSQDVSVSPTVAPTATTPTSQISQSLTSTPPPAVPPAIAASTASPPKELPVATTEKTGTPAPEESAVQKQSKQPVYNAYASPYNLLKKPISSYVHASRQQRLLIPSIIPSGMDPQSIIEERERRLRSRIQYRVTELENLPSDISSAIAKGTNQLGNAQVVLPSVKMKAIIELKALKLLDKQKKLREEIITGMTRSTTLATSADRMAFRRMKKQSLREARITEKIERQQRIDRVKREKQKHLDYLQMICDHGRNLVASHASWHAKQSKLGRAVLQFHQHIEKEEQKKAERISKERIRALRNDDEEAYMKLIDEAKDTRLTQLLKQTGAFLESLSKAVRDQQKDAISKGEEDDLALDDDNEAGGKVDYFQVTHRIKEEVSQPNMLVGGTLKEYQIKGLQWMVSLYNNHLNGILADEMGLGKTIQTISLITYLIEKKRQNGPFLIIVPLSTLTNWSLEFDKWAPSVGLIVYKGPPAARRALQMDIRRGDFQVLLTTFEYIIKDRPILSKTKWVHMIMDEGHRMKNTNSKLTTVLRQYYHTRYRLILTGTPLQNNLPELWALLNFILPKIFKSVKSFEEWFNTPFSNQGVMDKIDLNEEEQLLIIKRLHKVLRPFLLRRLKKDVESELPDKVERVIKCKLSSLQAKLYSQMKKNGILYTVGSDKGKASIKGLNNTIMQLRKICNHPFVFEEVENAINPTRRSNEVLYRVSGKFELLDRMLAKLRATGHRVLIFFQMTQIMSIMEDFLNYRNFPYLRLDGSTKADDRSELLQLFNAPDSPYFIFLLSTRAGGLGLNLQVADTVIIFDSDWNPHQDLQAQDRAHRIGQTKEVRIFRLISANSIEENILARANYKLDIDGKVIQAGKFDNRSTDEDREAFLRTLLEDKNDEEEDVDNEELDDEELNEMLKRSDQELAIFQKLDEERYREENELRRRMGYRGKKYERLIQEDELPEIYHQEDVPIYDEENVHVYGRGQRVRDSVRYDDGLTEEQWLNALEDEDVDMDQLIARKEARRRKRLEKLQNGEENLMDGGGRRGHSAMDDSSRKRGRSRRETENRRKRPKKESTGGPAWDPVPPHIRKQMREVFEKCYKAVEESREEDEDTYRERCHLFMDLVSKKDYPLYYKMIKNPISMNIIKRRIKSSHYKTLDQFRADFHLMFNNARIFNEEGSVVYEDAVEMEKIFNATLESLCPGGVLPNWETASVSDGAFNTKTHPAEYQQTQPLEYNSSDHSRVLNLEEKEEEEEEEEDDDDYDDEYDE